MLLLFVFLGCDIEANIRLLEKTQAKISAALSNFKAIQVVYSSDIQVVCTLQIEYRVSHKIYIKSIFTIILPSQLISRKRMSTLV